MAGISFVTYIFAGLIQNWVVSLIIGIVLTVGSLLVIRMISGRKNVSANA